MGGGDELVLGSGIDTTGLTAVEGFSFPVYVSGRDVARARGLAQRMARTLSWLGDLVEMPPTPPLFVLDPADWNRVALTPLYGLAHVNRTRVVIGQQPSGLWEGLVSRVWPELAFSARQRLTTVYGEPPDVSCFADLVISHELAHLADRPGHLDTTGQEPGWGSVPRVLWFVELFANLGLQGYVSDCEPHESSRLETLFDVIGSTPAAMWPINALSAMYDTLTTPGADGSNYCWYEFRLQRFAKRLWEARGAASFKTLHTVLHGPLLTDDELVEVIADIDTRVAADVRRWLGVASR
jgi:hypothetical protein